MNLRMDDVTFSYPSGVLALNHVSLSMRNGESLAILGENGAGKTTLARQLNGLLRPQSGSIWIGDWDTRMKTVAQLSARVGFVFQNPNDQLFARSVWEEVAFGPRNLDWEPDQVNESVVSALARVGLLDAAKKHPYDLPATDRKFVALAATLAMRTPIVVLDEPTTGQDAAGMDRMGGIVEALKLAATAVIAITHDIDFCVEHFPRVVVMTNGRVISDGPTGAVLTQPTVLGSAGLRAPQMARLAQALGIESTPLTVDEFVKAYRSLRKTRRDAPWSS